MDKGKLKQEYTSSQIIVYSHGFGVRKDDRGLFTDIASALQDYEHIMFDYNEFDETKNNLTARPLDEQFPLLSEQINNIQSSGNKAIDIIAHSQGCVTAALAKPKGIRKTIFLAPPAQFLGLEKQDIYKMRPDTVTDKDGTIHMPRRDGSTTIIKYDYWNRRRDIKPIELYNALAEVTQLTIITATEDEVLTNTDFSGLSDKITLIKLRANHNFTEDRIELMQTINKVLGKNE